MCRHRLPEEQGIFTAARPFLRTVVKNLSLSLLAGNVGQVPAYAMSARLKEMQLAQAATAAKQEPRAQAAAAAKQEPRAQAATPVAKQDPRAQAATAAKQ